MEGEKTTEHGDEFHIAVRRSKAFTYGIKSADPVSGRQLAAAWKEIIIENFLKAVQGTGDTELLTSLDHQAGLVLSLMARER